MASAKGTTDSINFAAVGKRISAVDEVFKNPEFQKIITQLATASPSDREALANSELQAEALGKRGIEIPKGTKINFKPAKEGKKEGKAGSAKKKLTVNLLIPGIGTIAIRAGIKDKTGKAKEKKD